MELESFVQNFTKMGVIYLIVGVFAIFISIAMPMALLNAENTYVVENGVWRLATEEDGTLFAALTTLIVGVLTGTATAIIGVLMLLDRRKQQFLMCKLKGEGNFIWAELIDRKRRFLFFRLHCSYEDANGHTYTFKSPFIQNNPLPYLDQRKLKVYWDDYDARNYYVDVDESVALAIEESK